MDLASLKEKLELSRAKEMELNKEIAEVMERIEENTPTLSLRPVLERERAELELSRAKEMELNKELSESRKRRLQEITRTEQARVILGREEFQRAGVLERPDVVLAREVREPHQIPFQLTDKQITEFNQGLSPDTVMSPSPALPEGWVAHKSRSTGETYYRNDETGATQWDQPIAAAPAPDLEKSNVVKKFPIRALMMEKVVSRAGGHEVKMMVLNNWEDMPPTHRIVQIVDVGALKKAMAGTWNEEDAKWANLIGIVVNDNEDKTVDVRISLPSPQRSLEARFDSYPLPPDTIDNDILSKWRRADEGTDPRRFKLKRRMGHESTKITDSEWGLWEWDWIVMANLIWEKKEINMKLLKITAPAWEWAQHHVTDRSHFQFEAREWVKDQKKRIN
jgi:hypothetical protein